METWLYTKKELEFLVMKLIDVEFPLCTVRWPYLEQELKTKIKDIDRDKLEKEWYYRHFRSPRWTRENLCWREWYMLVQLKEDGDLELVDWRVTILS